MPSPSRSHCTAAPATKTDPSRQYVTCPPSFQPTVVKRLFAKDGRPAGVHQQEAAGAIGVLRGARGEARLAEGGGLLVAGVARKSG